MPLLNVNLNVLGYLDGPKTANPRMKLHDTTLSIMGLPTEAMNTTPIDLAPGESVTLASTLRSISYTGATAFAISKSQATARLSGSFGQRTGRSDGDATTQWTVSVSQELVTLTFTGTGTAPNFGSMQPGDGVTLDAPFSSLNRGDFIVVKVGASYIQFVNPIAAGETVVGQVDVYSSGPVQKGDVLDLTSSAFAFPNRGQFSITRVTDTFVEFSNPNAVPETGISGVLAGELNVYRDAYQWLLIAVEHRAIVRLNASSNDAVEVSPPVDGDLTNNPGIMLKRGRVYQVQIFNPTNYQLKGFLFLAE